MADKKEIQENFTIRFSDGIASIITEGAEFSVTPNGSVTVYTDKNIMAQKLEAMLRHGMHDGFYVSVYGVIISKIDSGFAVQADRIEKSRPDFGNQLQVSNPNRSSAPKVLRVGDHLSDGTVVIYVDPEKDEALFVPERVFAGKARFNKQDDLVESINEAGLHGHKDWRRITDTAGDTLAEVWNKVAPKELQGPNAPLFWISSSKNLGLCGSTNVGGGKGDIYSDSLYEMVKISSLPVPVIRSGPAKVPRSN